MKQLFWVGFAFLVVGVIIGALVIESIRGQELGEYDLYQCIENNARMNDFNQNPVMIEKIQDECICFRRYNYTNLLEADC